MSRTSEWSTQNIMFKLMLTERGEAKNNNKIHKKKTSVQIVPDSTVAFNVPQPTLIISW